MSLDFDIRKIKCHVDVCLEADGTTLKPVTFALIHYAGLIAGIPDITARNKDEFYRRVHLWDSVIGPLISSSSGPVDVTREMVAAHVGLTTNGDVKSARAFTAHLQREAYRKALEAKRHALMVPLRVNATVGPWDLPKLGRVYAVRNDKAVAPVFLTLSEGQWFAHGSPKGSSPALVGFLPADCDPGPMEPLPSLVCALDVTDVLDHCDTVNIGRPSPKDFFP